MTASLMIQTLCLVFAVFLQLNNSLFIRVAKTQQMVVILEMFLSQGF